MNRFLTALALVVLLAVPVSAATVTFTAIEGPAGIWTMSAEVAGADTGGLASYSVDVTSTDSDANSWVQDPNLNTINASFQPLGFASPAQTASFTALVPQLFNAASLQGGNPIFGIGKSVISDGGPFPPGTQIDVAVPAVLGVLDLGGATLVANSPAIRIIGGLYDDSGGGQGYLNADLFETINVIRPIPEPSSIALLSIALLSLVGYGRRRS